LELVRKNVTQWRDDWELISIKDFLSIKNKRLVKHRLSSFSDGKLSIGKVRAGILGWIISDGTIKKDAKNLKLEYLNPGQLIKRNVK